MRIIIAASVLAITLGSQPASAGDSAYCGQRLVVVGDSPAAVQQACGQPSRVVRLENNLGAAVGERWEYFRDRKTLSITIQRGRVSRIVEQ